MEEMGNMIAEVTKETKSVEITEVAGVANYIKDATSVRRKILRQGFNY